jgi:hypothetical protein
MNKYPSHCQKWQVWNRKSFPLSGPVQLWLFDFMASDLSPRFLAATIIVHQQIHDNLWNCDGCEASNWQLSVSRH